LRGYKKTSQSWGVFVFCIKILMRNGLWHFKMRGGDGERWRKYLRLKVEDSSYPSAGGVGEQKIKEAADPSLSCVALA
jgi:hypothetical protein